MNDWVTSQIFRLTLSGSLCWYARSMRSQSLWLSLNVDSPTALAMGSFGPWFGINNHHHPPPMQEGWHGASRTAVGRCPATDRESGSAPNQ
jgi:hypothetical protein